MSSFNNDLLNGKPIALSDNDEIEPCMQAGVQQIRFCIQKILVNDSALHIDDFQVGDTRPGKINGENSLVGVGINVDSRETRFIFYF